MDKRVIMMTDDKVKRIGRTYIYKDILWCALSGTGIECRFKGKEAEVTIVGDNIAVSDKEEGNYARIGIYINDKLMVKSMIQEEEMTFKVFESDESKDVTLRVIKLSESPMSTIGIKSIEIVTEDGMKPVKKRDKYIEFIGDSITCGYGIDDEDPEHGFTTATEDVTKAYAYKTAKELDAEYSMISYSGYGIISGYTGDEKKQNTKEILPEFYEKVGYSQGYFGGDLKPESLRWDFENNQPDLIVINLGTNDYSYCKENQYKRKEFTKRYEEFLKVVRENNPQSNILCTLGIKGAELFECIEKAVDNYMSSFEDEKIYVMKFEEQVIEDGLAADYHPTEKTNIKAAAQLVEKIKAIMNW